MSFWSWAIRPILFRLPAERVHECSMGTFHSLMRLPGGRGITRGLYRVHDPRLTQTVLGLDFPNPVGLAAGFDKNARWFDTLATLGFGAIEIGSVTGQGQPGNPKPRLFRLPLDRALINRMGFNNDGAEQISRRLERSAATREQRDYVLGVNLGKTKVVPLEQADDDYEFSFRQLFRFGDYFVINVSSPNTPGLRTLQDRQPLERLLLRIQQTNESLAQEFQLKPKPVLLKIAPDLTDEQIDEIEELAVTVRLSGLIATNTTLSRDGLATPAEKVTEIGAGGLSGRPLRDRSCQVVHRLYRQLGQQMPIIGVGGIFDGADAWRMITHGATLVQLYTGFIYGGPQTVRQINRYLADQLARHQLDNISQAIGRTDLSD